jgi:hypothetical protein
MRAADMNDANLVLKLYELRRETEMRKARAFIITFSPATAADALALFDWNHPENAHFRQVTSYWEMVADFALREILHPEMFATHCGEAFVIYARFEPHLAEVRKAMSPRFLANMSACVERFPAVAEKLTMIRGMLAARAKAAAAK